MAESCCPTTATRCGSTLHLHTLDAAGVLLPLPAAAVHVPADLQFASIRAVKRSLFISRLGLSGQAAPPVAACDCAAACMPSNCAHPPSLLLQLRVIVPGYVGARQVKRLSRIVLSEDESEVRRTEKPAAAAAAASAAAAAAGAGAGSGFHRHPLPTLPNVQSFFACM